MNSISGWFKSNFGYSRKEINGTIVLLLLVLLSFIFSYVWDYYLYTNSPDVSRQELNELEKWAAGIRWKSTKQGDENHDSQGLLVEKAFDPNNVTSANLQAMNLPEYVAGNWAKFLASGGKFYEKRDVLKIYGMEPEIYNQLEPWLTIAAAEKKVVVRSAENNPPVTPVHFAKLDINKATAEQLQTVKGIGPVFSERIVKYRHSLGGFYTKKQLESVYGIKPETIDNLWQKFDLDTAYCCRKIAINTAGFDSLRLHPYLTYNQARAIVAYREQHGPFLSWHDLAEVRIVPDSLVEKMKVYFEF